MGIFSRPLKPEQDPLQKQAETLVAAAQVNADGMLISLLQRFPILHEVKAEHWKFFVTVAGVFMSSSRLNGLHVGDDREEKLMETVADRLEKWNANGIRAFDDCKDLYEKEYDRLAAIGHETRFLASDAVGIWIVWNVLGRAPDGDTEFMLVRAAGGMVTQAFFDWWGD